MNCATFSRLPMGASRFVSDNWQPGESWLIEKAGPCLPGLAVSTFGRAGDDTLWHRAMLFT